MVTLTNTVCVYNDDPIHPKYRCGLRQWLYTSEVTSAGPITGKKICTRSLDSRRFPKTSSHMIIKKIKRNREVWHFRCLISMTILRIQSQFQSKVYEISSEQPPHHNCAVHSQTAANVIYMATALNPSQLCISLSSQTQVNTNLYFTTRLLGGGAISHSPNLPTLLITVSWRFYKPTRYKLAQPHHIGSAPCSSIQTMENSLLRALEI